MPDLPTTHNLTTAALRVLMREAWSNGWRYAINHGVDPDESEVDADIAAILAVYPGVPEPRYRGRETGAVYVVTDRFTNPDNVEMVEMVTLETLDGFARCHVTLTELAESFEELTHD